MEYSHTIEPREVIPDGSYKHGAYMTPRWYCTKTYQTQIKGTTLAGAMLRAIRHACPSTVTSSYHIELWEVGQDEYLYVTNQKIARRAQEILIRYQKLSGDAYYKCSDLKRK